MLNYYEILRVSPTATFEEIKKSYQNLLLKYHPDKNTFESCNNIYYSLNQAWQTLKIIEKRKMYDAELLQTKFNNEPVLFDTISKDEFFHDEESECYFYLCRCGGRYVATFEMINSIQYDSLISCDECSLVIKYLVK